MKSSQARPQGPRGPILSWALYEWANTAFATTVMAGFFPVFFKQFWSVGISASESTFQLGVINSLASLILAVVAPSLGAMADLGSAKKRYLLICTTIGVIATATLFFVARGEWLSAALLFVVASVGYSGGNLFFNALMSSACGGQRLDWVSGLGYAFGYLGGGILFALNVTMTVHPHWFGLTDATQAVRWSFVLVALWWSVFSLPLFLNVPEPRTPHPLSRWAMIVHGFRQPVKTFAQLRQLRPALIFLLAYFFYIDGVSTIVRMAVDYGMSLGFHAPTLMAALLITQFVGFPAALAFGWLGERMGAKVGIFIAIAVYMGVTVWSYRLEVESQFYAVAAVIGLVQGGIQSLSRSLYARLTPANQSGEFFGLFNMLGRFSAVMGPLLVGVTSHVTGNPRLSILSVLILFIVGSIGLAFVKEPLVVGP